MTHLARHSLSHAVRRIVKDKKLAKFTPSAPKNYLQRLHNHLKYNAKPKISVGRALDFFG
jgi:hypothetical protein